MGFSPLKKWGIVQTHDLPYPHYSRFSPLKKWGIVQIVKVFDQQAQSFSPLKKWGIVQRMSHVITNLCKFQSP